MNEKLIEKIISVAYGDGSIADRISVGIMAMRDKEVMALLKEYRNTAKEVHETAEEEFPDSSVRKVFESAGIKTGRRFYFGFDIFSIFVTKPYFASAAAFVLVGLLVTTMFIKNRRVETAYSQEEIEQAGLQAQQVFKAIDEVFNKARIMVEDDVLREQVAKPMNRNLNKISKLIKEGEIE